MKCLAAAVVLILAASPLLAQSANVAGAKSPVAVDAKSVHASAIVIDSHVDTAVSFTDEGFDPGKDAGNVRWDLPKAAAGNLGAEFFSIWVDPNKYGKDQRARRAMDMIDAVNETVRHNSNAMTMAYTAADIRAARAQTPPKLAALLGIEGGHAIENDPRMLRIFYKLGVRYMSLTWTNSIEWATSAGGYGGDAAAPAWKDDKGLSMEGRAMVREMNRLGMMVDVSHVSDRTFYNALTASRAPVIASHSAARALTNQPRNLSDEMLTALARNGGVAQVNFYCGYLSSEYKEGGPRPPLSALIDHIDHIVKVAGIDHVGLGSDFPYISCSPQGLDSIADLPKITEALAQRGYSAEAIRKILGGNLLRVMEEAEAVARQMQAEENTDTRPVVRIPVKSVQ
jgi:membrane dipeptidase